MTDHQFKQPDPVVNAGELVRRAEQALEIYDPVKGLEKIGDAEAGAAKCRRAGDDEGLRKAIADRIIAEADYVVWRDAAMAEVVRLRGGGGPGRGKKGPAPARLLLPEGDPGQDVIDRWRKAFCLKTDSGTVKDPEKIKFAWEDAVRRAICICEQKKPPPRGTLGTGDDEWYTPSEYIELARQVLGTIDLDPATCLAAQQIIKAKTFYTKQEDGLVQEWHGHAWLNPPCSLIEQYVQKLCEEWQAGRVTEAILLTHNNTDTAWFHQIADHMSAICFTEGRIKFYDGHKIGESPPQGQAFAYFGPHRARFAKVFDPTIGFVLPGRVRRP